MERLGESLDKAKELLEGKRKVARRETVWKDKLGNVTKSTEEGVEEEY